MKMYLQPVKGCVYALVLFFTFCFNNVKGQTTLTTRATGNWNANDTWLSNNLTGTITTSTSSATVTGTGTNFTTQLAVGAALYKTDGTTLIGTVQSITSATLLTLTANAVNANTLVAFRTRKVPAAGDPVIMSNNGFNVTIPASVAASCASLNIGVTGTSSAETLSFSAATSSLNVNGNLTVFGPTGAATRQILINAGSLNVTGNLSMGDGNTGNQANRITKLVITTGTVTVSGNLVFNTGNNALQAQVIMSGGAGVFNLAGSFTSALSVGTLTAGTTSTFNFNGSTAQTIPTGVSSIIYNNIGINNTSSSGVTISGAVTTANVKGSIRLLGGKFSNNGFAMAGNAGKTLQVANGTSFNVSGTTSSFPSGFSTYTLGASSTVTYNGSANQVVFDVPAPGYGNLVLSNSGIKTAASGLDIQGAINLNGIVTFVAGSFTHNIKGNWTNNGSAFTSTGSTIQLNGTTVQTVGGTSPAVFNSLRINNSAGVLLTADVTVNGTLTFTNGIVDAATNNKTVTIGSSGTSAGGSATTYINGRLARVITSTAATAFTIGKGGKYRPVTFTYATTTSKTVTIEQIEAAFPVSIPSSTSVSRFGSHYWTVAQSAAGTNFTLGLNNGGIAAKGTVMMLRSENGGTASSNATAFTSPTYRNSTSFSTTSASSAFALSETAIPLTVTGATTSNKVYDGTVTATVTGGTLSGVISPDVVTLIPSGKFANKNVGINKAITGTFTISGANAAAYKVTQPALTARSITVRTLTVTATASNKVYNGNVTATVLFSDNRISGDVLTVTKTTANFVNKNVGTGKAVAITGIAISAGADRNNYTLASNTASAVANITARALTITAIANTKVYNALTTAAAKPTITTGAVQTGDVANFTEAYNNKNAGTGKTMIPSGIVTDGNSGNNYTYTFVNSANGTITKRALTVRGAANTKAYDGTTSAAALPTITAGILQAGDIANFIQSYNNAVAGINKTMIPSGTANDGNSGGNYTYTFVNSSNGTITVLGAGVADYRSKASGNLSSLSTWQYDAGTGSWLNAIQLPGLNNNITVQNGHTVSVDVNYVVGPGKTLLINNGGALTIEPNQDLSVAAGGTLNFNGQPVTVKSSAAGTGSIGKILGTLSGETNVTIERYISVSPRRAYRLLSAPTTGQTIRQAWQEGAVNPNARDNNKPGYGTQISGVAANLTAAEAAGLDSITPSASLRMYNGAAFVGVNNTNTAFANTSGYFIYIRGDRSQGPSNSVLGTNATILRSTGTMYKGNQQTTGIANGQFALIGNVYPSAIEFTSLGRSNVANTFYLFDAQKGPGAGGYETFSATNNFKSIIGGGSWNFGDSNSVIQSGHAFFVLGTGAGGSVTLNENSKITGSNNRGFRPAGVPAKTLKLNTRLLNKEGKAYDGNVVVFDKVYSSAVDADDAVKLENPNENFAVARDGKVLAIEARPAMNNEQEILFEMKNMKQQDYKLEFTAMNMATVMTAFLEDNYLKTKTPLDLASTTVVNFTVNADAPSAASNRFKVVFRRVAVTVAVESKPSIKVFPNPVEGAVMNIQFTKQEKGRYNIRLVDLAGRLVYVAYKEHAGGSASQSIALPAAVSRGTYELIITAPDKTRKVEKVFINSAK